MSEDPPGSWDSWWDSSRAAPRPRNEPPLGDEERKLLIRLLEELREVVDEATAIELDNTDANWALWCDALSSEDSVVRPIGPTFFAQISNIAPYLAHRLSQGAR